MEEINLMELFSYFKAKIIWILIAIVSVIIVGNVYTLVTREPMYQSNTTIVLVSENKENFSQSDLQLNKNLIGTYSEIIKSRKVLTNVINNLELKTTTTALSNNISVVAIENTEIIKITVNDIEATDACRIADEVAKVFAKEIKAIYNLENVEIIDEAIVAEKPYNVNYVKDNVLYVLIGLVLSCGVIFIMFYFDTTIKSSEIVEDKLGLTVLGIVPNEEKE